MIDDDLPADELDRALTAREAAKFLGYSRRTFRDMCNDGTGPEAYRRGGSGPRRFRMRKLVEWQEKREREEAAISAGKRQQVLATRSARLERRKTKQAAERAARKGRV